MRCHRLVTNNNKTCYSLWPPLARLHREQREHRGRDVVVVEALSHPLARADARQQAVLIVQEIRPSASGDKDQFGVLDSKKIGV